MKTIRIILPAGGAKPGQPLGPILGQNQINLTTFCSDFNKKTSLIVNDIPLSIKILKMVDKSYRIVISPPPIREFFGGSDITISQLQDLLIVLTNFNRAIGAKDVNPKTVVHNLIKSIV